LSYSLVSKVVLSGGGGGGGGGGGVDVEELEVLVGEGREGELELPPPPPQDIKNKVKERENKMKNLLQFFRKIFDLTKLRSSNANASLETDNAAKAISFIAAISDIDGSEAIEFFFIFLSVK